MVCLHLTLLFQLSRLHFSWKKHVSLDVESSMVLLERLDTRGAWWQERKKLSLPHLLPEKHQHSPGLSHYNHLKQSWNKINTGVIFWAKSKKRKKKKEPTYWAQIPPGVVSAKQIYSLISGCGSLICVPRPSWCQFQLSLCHWATLHLQQLLSVLTLTFKRLLQTSKVSTEP